MKKQKIAAIALAAALLVGGTFVGTKALFTDKVSGVSEISISTGDLDIELEEVAPEQGEGKEAINGWTLYRNGEEANIGSDPDEHADADNLKTGDVLIKTVKVKNNGTLKALLTLDRNTEITGQLPKGIEYYARLNGEVVGSGKEFELDAENNQYATLEFVIEVTGGGEHRETGSLNSEEQEPQIINLKDSYTINATQQDPHHVGEDLGR